MFLYTQFCNFFKVPSMVKKLFFGCAVLFCILFSIESFGQVNAVAAVHETDNQNVVVIRLDGNLPGAFTCTGGCVGSFTLVIGGNPVVITSAIGAAGANQITVTFPIGDAVGIGETVFISYDGTGPAGLNAFANLQSFNNRPIDCSDFDFEALIGNTPPCAPVNPQNKMVFSVTRGARNSSAWSLNDIRARIVWNPGVSTLVPFESNSAAVPSPNTYFIAFDAAPDAHTYPNNDPECGYISLWRIRLFGSINCAPSSPNQQVTYASHNTDAIGEGTGELLMPPVGTNLVCLGENVNMQFTDNTDLNCNPVADANIPVNDRIRWVRVVYGSQDLGAGNNIPDISVDGVQVTDNNGVLLFPGGYFPVAPDPTTFGNPDPFGVVTVPEPVNNPRGLLELITTTLVNNQAVGQRFWVRLDYWNVCNPYDGSGDLISGNRRSIENFIEIVDVPPPSVADNREICFNGAIPTFRTTGNTGGGTVNWYADAAGVPGALITSNTATGGGVATLPGATGGVNNTVPGIYTVWSSYVGPSGGINCESDPIPVTITVRNNLNAIDFSPISGPVDVCNNTNNVPYSVPLAAPVQIFGGATDYQWDVAGGGGVTFNAPVNQETLSVNYNIGTQPNPSATRTLRTRLRYTTTDFNGSLCPTAFETLPVTIFGTSLGGNLTANQTICNGVSFANLVLTGRRGDVLRWERSFNGGAFGIIGGTAGLTTFSETPATPGEYRYRVVVQNGPCNPANSTVVTINVNPVPPQPTITQVGDGLTICDDGANQTILQSSNVGGVGVRFDWFRLPDTATPVQSGVSNQLILDDPSEAGDYVVRVFGVAPTQCPSTLSDPVTVSIFPLPSATASGGGAVCSGNPAPDITWNFTGTGPFNFTINVSTGPNIVETNFAGGSYTIVGPSPGVDTDYELTIFEDANGCFAAPGTMGGPISVSIGGAAPDVENFFASPDACDDGATTVAPSLTLDLDGGVANYTLTYEIDGILQPTLNFSTNASGIFVIQPNYTAAPFNTTPGTYTYRLVSIINNDTGCASPLTDQEDIVIHVPPNVTTQPTNEVVCVDDEINFNVVANTSGSNLSFQWEESTNGGGTFNPLADGASGGVTYSGTNTNTLTINNAIASLNNNIYRVIVTAEYGTGPVICETISNEATLTVNPLPTINNLTPDLCSTNPLGNQAINQNLNSYNSSINGGAGLSFAWFTDAALTTPVGDQSSHTVTDADTYFVRVTINATGCENVATVTFDVDPTPEAIDQDQDVCSDAVFGQPGDNQAEVDLTLNQTSVNNSGGVTFAWFTDAGLTLPIADPTAHVVTDGIPVFVEVTDNVNNCTNVATITYTVDPTPVADDQNPVVCSTDPGGSTAFVDLTANNTDINIDANTPGFSVFWFEDYDAVNDILSNPIAPGGAVGQSSNFQVSDGVPIYAQVVTAEGCDNVAEVTYVVNPRPVDNPILGNANVCVNPTTTVLYQVDPDLNPGSTYAWNIPNGPGEFVVVAGGGSTGSDGDFFVLLRFPNVFSGVIQVTETSPEGCVGNTMSFGINVDPIPPALEITGDAVVCENQAGVTYQVPPNATSQFFWTVPPGSSIIAGQGGSTIQVNFGSISGNITVSETSATGCAGAPASRGVTVTPRPQMNANQTATVCSGEPGGIVFNIISAEPAAFFNITDIQVPGALDADPGNASTGPGQFSNAIENDRFTNLTNTTLEVRYTVVPVGATGCEGTPRQVRVNILPEPRVSSNLNREVCSDENIGLTLATAAGSVAAASYDIVDVIIPGTVTSNAGNAAFPANTTDLQYLATDIYTNISGSDQDVIYRVQAIAGNGCNSEVLDIIVTIRPEPVLNPGLSTVVCSGDITGIVLTVQGGSVAATNFDISAVADPGLVGVPTTGNNLNQNAILNDIFQNTTAGPLQVTYTIVPKSSLGCAGDPVNVNVTVEPSPEVVNINRTECSDTPGGNTFDIDLTTLENTITLGVGGLTINWFEDAGLTTPIADPANHTLTSNVPVFAEVGDGNCANVASVNFTINPSPSVTGIVTSNYNGSQVSCFDTENGQITATPDNGTAPYQFSINGGTTFFGSNIFNGLAPGIYVVTVRDNRGCLADSAPIEIVAPDPIAATLAITSNYNGEDISCLGANDAELTVTTNGGTGTYTYNIVELPGNLTGQITGIFTGVGPGTYTVRVRDVNLCTFITASVTVENPPQLTITASVTSNYNGSQITCAGETDGVITAIAGGGTGDYTFRLFDAADNPLALQINDGVFVNRGPGTYYVRVTDDNNCFVNSNQFTITAPPALAGTATVANPFNGAQISCNGEDDGSITINPSGGTGARTFELFDNGGISIAGPQASNVFNVLEAGTYSVTIRDLNNCDFDVTNIIIVEPDPIVASGSVTSNYNGADISCNGGSDGRIAITANGGTGNYTYLLVEVPGNTSGLNNGVFTNLSAGSYTVTVTDVNGCNVTTAPIEVTEPDPVDGAGSVTSDYFGSDVTCVGAADGEITVAGSGGTGAFTYRINQIPANTSGLNSGIFTGIPAGNYTITVTDANNCSFTTPIITVSNPAPPTVSASVTSNFNGSQISCNGQNDGVITAAAAGGSGNITFELIDEVTSGVVATQLNNPIFQNLIAGIYRVRIIDANGCNTQTGIIILTEPAPVAATAVISSNYNGSNINCPGDDDAEITVNATGGTGAYEYQLLDEFNNELVAFQPGNTFANLGPGTYRVRVRDVNDCSIVTNDLTINDPAALDASIAVTSNFNGQEIRCFGEDNGQITVTATGGSGTRQYRLFNADTDVLITGPQTSTIFNDLVAGNYYVIVNDANNCQFTTNTVTIDEPDLLEATAAVTSSFNGFDLSCVGALDGQITVTPTGGTGPFTFRLNQIPSNTSGETDGIFTNLPAGTYTIDVRDVNNCQVITAAVTITPPPALDAVINITSDFNGSDISCAGQNDGEITATPTGGTGPGTYTFELVNFPGNTSGNVSGTYEGLVAGTYRIRVTDANGCVFTTSPITLIQPVALSASATVTSNYNGSQISCNGADDAVLTVNANGGTGAYTFVLDQDPTNTTGETTGVFTGLAPGSYTVTVLDANFCVVGTAPRNVIQPGPVNATGVVSSNFNGSPISCNGEDDGAITITATGGTGAFIYVLDQDPGNTSGETSGVFTGLTAGTYTVTVTDVNDCSATTADITLNEPAAVDATALVTSNYNGSQISCNGASDGQISITATGGTGAFLYELVGGGNISGATNGVFTGLAAGTYEFDITDVNGCTFTTAPVTIIQPDPVGGSVSITSSFNGADVSCNGAEDGVLLAVGTGGTAPYVYQILQLPANTTGATTGEFTGVGAGTYTVRVRDANNCIFNIPDITVTQPTPIATTRSVTSDYNGSQISCNGFSDGEITINPTGGTGAYTYVLDQIPANTTGETTGIFTGLPAGTYTVTVTDGNGCPHVTQPITVTEPAPVSGSGAVTSNYGGADVSCAGEDDGIITITANGGTGAYEFEILDENEVSLGEPIQTSNAFPGLGAGTYTFRIIDVNGCDFITGPVTIVDPPALDATAAITSDYNGEDISCFGASDGRIRVTPTGGTGNYSYEINELPGNVTGANTGIFTGLPSGTYTITVTDLNGCDFTTTPLTLNDPAQLTATAAVTSDYNGAQIECFAANNGEITVTAGGGTLTGANYLYQMIEDPSNMTGQASGVFTNVRPGTYTFRITDDNGCVVITAPVVIDDPDQINVDLQITSDFNGFDVSCFDADDGVIVATATGGTLPITYTLTQDPTNTTGENSGIFTGLEAGLYTVVATDVNGCNRTSFPVVVNEPFPLSGGFISGTQQVCQGDDPASFAEIAAPFGGIGNYQYQWQESASSAGPFTDIPGATGPIYNPPVLANTTFFRRQVISGGSTCDPEFSNIVSVTVNDLPDGAISASVAEICTGDFFLLEFNFTGTAPFRFDYNDGTNFFNNQAGAATTPVPILGMTETTTFTLTRVRDLNNCEVVLNEQVTVNVIDIDASFDVAPVSGCSPHTVTFTYDQLAGVEYTWQWFDGSPDSTYVAAATVNGQTVQHTFNNPSPTSTGNYNVFLTAERTVGGVVCIDIFNRNVQVAPTPFPLVFPSNTEICGGDNIFFNNQTQGAGAHRWFYRVQGTTDEIDVRTTISVNYTFNNTTTQNPIIYEVVYEAINGACSRFDIIPITVYREVAPSFTVVNLTQFIGGQATMTLQNTSNPIDDEGDFEYVWTFGPGATPATFNGANPPVVTYSTPGLKEVQLTVTNRANGACFGTVIVPVNVVLPPLVADFVADPISGCRPLTVNIIENNSTGDIFEWLVIDNLGNPVGQSIAAMPSFNLFEVGTYTIRLTTRNSITGQFEDAEQEITVYPIPLASFDFRPRLIYLPDQEMSTFNFSSNANLFFWDFGDGGTSEQFEPKHLYTVAGNYNVTLIAAFEHPDGVICADTLSAPVAVQEGGNVRIPNAFTPSLDGPTGGVAGPNTVNDVFLPLLDGVEEFNMLIFDRWGNLIFESNNRNIGWDGYNRNGRLLPQGVYVYKLTLRLTNGERVIRIGDVTLIR